MKKFLLLVVVIIALFFAFHGSETQPEQKSVEIQSVPATTPVENPDVEYMVALGDSFDSAPATESTGGLNAKVSLECEVESASLHLSATVANDTLDEYDNLYVYMSNGVLEIGGHVNYESEIDLSKLQLFSLGHPEAVAQVNALTVLNFGNAEKEFQIFISSARGDRRLVGSLNYTCQ